MWSRAAARMIFAAGLKVKGHDALRLVAVALSLSAVPGLLYSQGRQVFRTTATRVVIDVVVVDKQGHFVTDLTRDDFELRDGRHLQTISDFERVSIPVDARHDVGLTIPAADVFSNAAPTRSARAFVFVVAHVDTSMLVRTKTFLNGLLDLLNPEDRAAIVYPWRSDLSQDFTRDVVRLRHAADNLRAALGLVPAFNARDDVDGLRNAIHAVATAPEQRRVVVFVSETAASIWLDSVMRQAVDEARRLNVPIYTVDPRGLAAPELGLDGRLEDQTPERVRALNDTIRQQKDRLRELAANTNGRAFVDHADVASVTYDLLASTSFYYLLGFSPEPQTTDGRFHRVHVKVRRPGLEVRFREGYYPASAPQAATPAEHLSALLEASVPTGDLALEACATPVLPSSNETRTLLTLRVSYPVQSSTAAIDRLAIMWVAIDSDGKIRGSAQYDADLQVSKLPETDRTIALDRVITVPRSASTLRLAVWSSGAGVGGVIHIPMDARSFGNVRIDATPLMIAAPADVPRLIRADHLAGLGDKYLLTTRREFERSEQMMVLARIFSRGGNRPTVELRLAGRGGFSQLIPVALTPVAELESVADASATLDLRDVSPGPYILELTVSPHVTGNTIRRSVGITLR